MNVLDLLTARLFDYAGMFPPESLAFKDAMAEAARAGRLHRPALVGNDMVVASPDLRLVTPKALETAGFEDTLCSIALVGIPAEALKRTIPRIQAFNEKNLGHAHVASLEIDGTKFDTTQLAAARDALADVRLYVEPHLSDRSWAASGAGLINMLGRLAQVGDPVGLKVRASGPRAISARTLAWMIPQVTEKKVGLKVTAGMHHPIVEAEYRNSIGFLGAAAALRLRQAMGADFGPEAILGCVQENRPDAFSFEGELAWRGHAVALEAVAQAMESLPFSIGSCSLQEPDRDLVRLFGSP